MNTAIHIISIQHQLVLGIGNSCDINKTLHQFLQVCNARLGLTSSHIFLFQNSKNYPVKQQLKIANNRLCHYLSFPSKKNNSLWCSNQQLMALANDFYHTETQNNSIKIGTDIYHSFKIKDIGILILECKKPLDKTIQHAMTPVLQKLSTSCIAMLEHNALIQEIKTRKEAEKKMSYQASHDHITALFNRQEIEQILEKEFAYCKENKKTASILLIDLVQFKNINVLMGHYVGDEILHQLAIRLKTVLQTNCTVARFCGDEFLILLTQLPCQQSKVKIIINNTIAQIISVVEPPFNVQDNVFSISCFIGYEIFDHCSTKVSDIIKNAELAMYEAAKNGGVKALGYNPKMSELLNMRLNYAEKIKKGLENKEFELHYQPQFNHFNNIIGVEALLRWHSLNQGYESPEIYIPIAEESDLIVQIGDFVLNQACKDIKRLEKLTLPDSFKQVSINISAKQLAKDNFVELVISAIQDYKIEPTHLKIEITESILMNNIQHSIAKLSALRHYGIECAIDDFGTGYSSLVYLKRLPANLLKIDRAFIMDIDKDENNIAITKMIINLAKNLNMEVIAEGVENKQELDCLIKLGCYQYQGYYFSRALPLNKLIELIKAN